MPLLALCRRRSRAALIHRAHQRTPHRSPSAIVAQVARSGRCPYRHLLWRLPSRSQRHGLILPLPRCRRPSRVHRLPLPPGLAAHHPLGPTRSPRQPRPIERDKRTIARLPQWQKSLILLWFSSCVRFIQSATDLRIDGDTVDMTRLFSSDTATSGGRSLSSTWNDLLIEIAREQSIGPMTVVDEEPLYSVFLIMWHNYKQSKRYENTTATHH